MNFFVFISEREEKLAKEKEGGKPEKKRKKYSTKKSKNTPAANTAGEAFEKMLQEKKMSTKINYDVLKSLTLPKPEKESVETVFSRMQQETLTTTSTTTTSSTTPMKTTKTTTSTQQQKNGEKLQSEKSSKETVNSTRGENEADVSACKRTDNRKLGAKRRIDSLSNLFLIFPFQLRTTQKVRKTWMTENAIPYQPKFLFPNY